MPSGGVKRRTAVQQVINLARHFPHAAAQLAAPEQLATLESTGQRRSAPGVRDGRGAR